MTALAWGSLVSALAGLGYAAILVRRWVKWVEFQVQALAGNTGEIWDEINKQECAHLAVKATKKRAKR